MEPPSHVTDLEMTGDDASERTPGQKTSREQAFGETDKGGRKVNSKKRAPPRGEFKIFKFIVFLGGIKATPQQPTISTAPQEMNQPPIQGAGSPRPTWAGSLTNAVGSQYTHILTYETHMRPPQEQEAEMVMDKEAQELLDKWGLG